MGEDAALLIRTAEHRHQLFETRHERAEIRLETRQRILCNFDTQQQQQVFLL